MAGFLKSNTASIVSGTKLITITGGLNCSYVSSGTAVYLDNILLEGISGTAPDPSGNSSITLRDTYNGASITNGTLVAFNTIEGLRDAIQRAREVTAGLGDITNVFGDIITATTPTIDVVINGVTTQVTPYGYLSNQVSDLVAIADGAADIFLGLQDDVTTLSNTVNSIQGDLDAKVVAASGFADSASASATSALTSKDEASASALSADDAKVAAEAARDVTTGARDVTLAARDEAVSAKDVVVASETVVTTAKDVVVAARDVTTSARDEAVSAKDLAVAAQITASTARDEAVAAKDETITARDLTLTYKDAAATSETNAAASASSASSDAALAMEWAISPNIIGIDQRSSKYWAEFAKENADLTSVSGGIFTPTLALEYPTVENPTRDTTFLVSFADPSDSYTFTTGDLLGVTVFSTYIMFWDAGLGEFKLVTSPSGAAILSVNGKTGSSITLTSLDISHGLGNVSASLDSKVNNTDIASTTVAGITTLSNNYAGIREDTATTEKALSEGLATKANTSHTHDTAEITSGVFTTDRLPSAGLSSSGVVQLSNSYLGLSEGVSVTEKALSDGLSNLSGTLSDVATSGSYLDLVDAPDLSSKQDTLISGTNIKTVNGGSILGGGNLEISTGITAVNNVSPSYSGIYKETSASGIAYLRPLNSEDNSITLLIGDTYLAMKVNASNITVGTMPIDRLPVGTLSTQVARGSHVHTFSEILSKPTTISGYGITNAIASDTTSSQSLSGQLTLPILRTSTRYDTTTTTAYFYVNGTERMRLGSSGMYLVGNSFPSSDNSYSSGLSGNRWSVIYAASSTISTSDERLKTELLDITDVEKACATELKGVIRKYKYTDSVRSKGDSARIHFGVGVQTVISVFEKHGLDPFEYGMVCYDEWEEERDHSTGEVTRAAGNIYGIRYEELLCFILASL